MRVAVITAPSPVVSVADAKKHLRVDHSDDDTYIEGLVAAATAWLDGPAGWVGRSLGVQTLEARVAGFGCYFERIELPCPPVIEILSVQYLDANGAEQTVDPSNYLSRDGEIWLKSTFLAPAVYRDDPLPVAIQYRAGYGVPPDFTENLLPPPVKVAILLLIGHWFENREPVVFGQSIADLPFAVEALLAPYRVYR